ncbi:polyamine aminopropyltransferase [Pseudophaeobacter arcticus]|uniref:Polyamine aminopropyltransferase n=1 Tax=Pseudophaeobacter arcticus TaxID=385492 RepID=A0ABQ0ALV7_9RHOB
MSPEPQVQTTESAGASTDPLAAAKSLRLREAWLLVATFLVAVAGLIYELIAATLSSYLLGDSVRQFSYVIGVFLSSMGLGAWLSRYVERPMAGFVWAQILLGIAGGFMAPAVFLTFAWMESVSLPLYGLLITVGLLSGLEIPLIARVLKDIGAPEFRFENVLSVDYIGALVASLAFPLLIIPHLGLMAGSLAFGALNLGVAGLSLWIFRRDTSRAQLGVWAIALLVTLVALWQAERLVSVTESNLFEDDIILSEATPYQQITVTRYRDRTRLFLDYSIQFDSLDEYRYHESLVHPAMSLAPRRKSVLILGGGDGMAAREVLRWAEVDEVTLVDLDPRVTELFRDHPDLSPLNHGSLSDPRLEIKNVDAWRFVEGSSAVYDVIIIDLPDPKNLALSKLYSRQFYGTLVERLSAQGIMVTQAGSPLFAREAFWSINATLQSSRNPQAPGAGLSTQPYHAYLPSFGDWGFVLASPQKPASTRLGLPVNLAAELKYLTPEVWQAAQVFDPQSGPTPVAVNTVQSHALVGYYLDGWARWFE